MINAANKKLDALIDGIENVISGGIHMLQSGDEDYILKDSGADLDAVEEANKLIQFSVPNYDKLYVTF